MTLFVVGWVGLGFFLIITVKAIEESAFLFSDGLCSMEKAKLCGFTAARAPGRGGSVQLNCVPVSMC